MFGMSMMSQRMFGNSQTRRTKPVMNFILLLMVFLSKSSERRTNQKTSSILQGLRVQLRLHRMLHVDAISIVGASRIRMDWSPPVTTTVVVCGEFTQEVQVLVVTRHTPVDLSLAFSAMIILTGLFRMTSKSDLPPLV